MITLAVALLLVSARLMARTVCVPRECGGVYKPALETVPTVLLPPVNPSTVQRTDLLVVLVTVAVNCCVCLKVRPAVLGRTLTDTCAAALRPMANTNTDERWTLRTFDWKARFYC